MGGRGGGGERACSGPVMVRFEGLVRVSLVGGGPCLAGRVSGHCIQPVGVRLDACQIEWRMPGRVVGHDMVCGWMVIFLVVENTTQLLSSYVWPVKAKFNSHYYIIQFLSGPFVMLPTGSPSKSPLYNTEGSFGTPRRCDRVPCSSHCAARAAVNN